MFDVLSPEIWADISWLAVAASTVASFVLGGLWFALTMPKPYAAAVGLDGPAPAPTPLAMAGPLVCNLVTIVTTGVLVEALGVQATGDAAALGLLVGIGYLAAMTFQIAINPVFARPLLYGAINAPYFVVTSVLSSVLLTAW